MPGRPVLFLFGPTAVGKTAMIDRVVGEPVEIVSADSMQVYRGLDIGTAKPPRELRDRLPHHLIDIRNPDEPYDVGAFVHDANTAIGAIHARGRLPLVAGGTGYYFRHLLYGLPGSPPSDPEVRARVAAEADRLGLDELRARLASVDPVSAGRIDEHDRYRITRALEVYEQTGRPLSDFAMVGDPRTDVEVVSVMLSRPREEIRRRIAARVSAMFEEGLRGEVERLTGAGYGPGDPGMRAIGYREFFNLSPGPGGTLRSPAENAAIANEIAVDTRRYAKRQRTFFARLPNVRELDADDVDGFVQLVGQALSRL